MPRNEFMNHEPDPLEGMTDLQIRDMLRAGQCTLDDVRVHRGLPKAPPAWEGSVDEEVPSQEADPIEDSPESPTLADLRKTPGATTTEAFRRKAT